MNWRRTAGLSLLELVLVIVILGAISAVTAPWLIQLTEGYRTGSDSQIDRNRTLIALERLQIAIRRADTVTQVDEQELILLDENGDAITWSIDGDTLQREAPNGQTAPVLRGLGPGSSFGLESAANTMIVTIALEAAEGPPIPVVTAYNRRGLQ